MDSDDFTLRAARAVALAELIAAERPGFNRADIILASVAMAFGVPVVDLKSSSKTDRVAFPRQIAMAIARVTTPYSVTSIARTMRRDHTTILFGAKKFRPLIEQLVAQRGGIDAAH